MMKTTEVAVNEYEQVAGGGIHDAVIQSFSFIEGDRFDICLSNASGKEKRFSLRGVKKIGFMDLVNGTIISEIFCWKLVVNIASLSSANEAWRVLLGKNYHERDFESGVARLIEQYPTHALVFFESSYGGAIAVMCQAMVEE